MNDPLDNLALEQRIIGTAIVSPGAAQAYVLDHVVRPEHFVVPAHRTIWSVVTDRLEVPDELDEIALSNLLARRPELLVAGTTTDDVFAALRATLEQAEGTASGEHAASLRDLAERRRLLGVLDHARRQTLQLNQPVVTTVTTLTEAAFGAGDAHGGPQFKSVRDRYFIRIPAYENPGPQPGFSLGFHGLDKVMSLRPGTVTVIAARPSMGKSLFVQQVISNVVHRHDVRAGLVSLEMDEDELLDRIIPYEANVSATWLTRAKKLAGDHAAEWERVVNVGDDAALGRFEYVDDVDLAIADIVTLVRRHAARHPDFKLLVVDYLGLVRHTDPKQLPVHAIAEISRRLKVLAIKLKIAVIALSQLSRGNEADRRAPRLSDLRDSGAIEQDADHVLFLHADAGASDDLPGGAESVPVAASEVIVAKNRSGVRGIKVPLDFDSKIPRFVDASAPRPNGVPLPDLGWRQ